MTARKDLAPLDAGAAYVFPDYPDDPTLGGAITVEMHDALQASAGSTPPDPDPTPPVEG